jgi:response regulator RpfG family c-di-GMP phosphodiesterase
LLVDDEADIVELIKPDLQHDSFDVIGFTNPQMELEHFGMNAKRIPLVISDVRMPQMNGYEFVKRVKKIKPKVKVFLMTAFEIDDLELTRVLPLVKIDEFIQKPIRLSVLNKLVRSHISA